MNAVKYQIIARAFSCLNHLTNQAFIWDQAAIWDRRLIPSSQKSEMKMSQTSPASRLILWHPSGQYLSSASEVVAAEETIQPTSTHSKLLISAVTHGGAHLFRHRPDHFTGPVAVLGQTLKLSLIYSPISRPLGVNRETSSGCFSRVFLCI